MCWSVGNLVLFEEKENCDVIIHDNVAQSCGSGLRQWGAIFLTTRYNTGVDLGPILSEKDLEEGKARWYQWVLMLGALSRALETKYSGGDRHSAENPPIGPPPG